MTVVAGFQCTDGVLLCADTQMTEGDGKFYESKILQLTNTCFLAYAGDRDFIKQELDGLKVAAQEGIEALRQKWGEIHQETIRRSQTGETIPPWVYGLIASLEGKFYRLYLASGFNLSPVEAHAEIGIGRDVARAFISPLYPRRLSGNEAARIGIFALRQAKDFVNGCGGETTIRMISNDVLELGAIEINPQELEKDYLFLQGILRPIFLGFPDISPKKQKRFREEVKDFVRRINNYRSGRLEEKEKAERALQRQIDNLDNIK